MGCTHPAEICTVSPYDDALEELITQYKEAGFKVDSEYDNCKPANIVYYLKFESDADLVKFKLQFKMPDLVHPFDAHNF